MLKIRLKPGEDYEKQLMLLSTNLNKIFQEGRDSGILKIIAYPSLSDIIAGLFLFNVSLKLNIKPSFKVATESPRRILVPTVLFGFRDINYSASDIESFLLGISNKVNYVPVLNSTFAELDGSPGAGLYLALKSSNTVPIKPEYGIIALASSYASRYVDRSGKFFSLDKILVNLLDSDTAIKLEMITGLKVFRPLSMNFCSSLSITLDPIYTIFANEEQCRSEIERNKLGKVLEEPMIRLDETVIKDLTIFILNLIKSGSRKEIEVTDFVGGMESSSAKIAIEDPRELALVTSALIDTNGIASALGSVADYENEYPQVIPYLKKTVEAAKNVIKNNEFYKVTSVNFARVYSLKEDNLPFVAIARTLKYLGYIEGDALIGYLDNNVLKIPAVLLEETLGNYSTTKLVHSLKGEFRDGHVYIKIR
ncbi:MAG: hypothetical protein F7B61_02610 [Caldisphaeraceae archaeon]|nr:hypothetical protein [Caldisphaeraceae archaeon]